MPASFLQLHANVEVWLIDPLRSGWTLRIRPGGSVGVEHLPEPLLGVFADRVADKIVGLPESAAAFGSFRFFCMTIAAFTSQSAFCNSSSAPRARPVTITMILRAILSFGSTETSTIRFPYVLPVRTIAPVVVC